MRGALGFRAKGRKIICADDTFELREAICRGDRPTAGEASNMRKAWILALVLAFAGTLWADTEEVEGPPPGYEYSPAPRRVLPRW